MLNIFADALLIATHVLAAVRRTICRANCAARRMSFRISKPCAPTTLRLRLGRAPILPSCCQSKDQSQADSSRATVAI
jgi:hypothetical protein